MTVIKVSEKVKQELEELKIEGEFKSLDAVIRHYIGSSIEVNGGIFLGSHGGVSWGYRNVRSASIYNCFVDLYITPPTIIKLYKCLKCQTTTVQSIERQPIVQRDIDPVIVPNCGGCGKGMTPITIQIG